MEEHAKRLLYHALNEPSSIQTMLDKGFTVEMLKTMPTYAQMMGIVFHFYVNGKYPLTPDSAIDQINARAKGDTQQNLLNVIVSSGEYTGSTVNDMMHSVDAIILFHKRSIVTENVSALLEKLTNSPDLNIEDELMSMLNVVSGGSRGTRFSHLGTESKEMLRTIHRRMNGDKGSVEGFNFGLGEFDEITGQFRRGWLIVLGAYSNQGKTQLAKSIARNLVLEGKRGLWVTAEESKSEVIEAIVSGVCMLRGLEVPTNDIRNGTLTREQQQHLVDCYEEFTQLDLYTWEVGHTTPAAIAQRIRTLQATKPLDFVVVDYIQLINSDNRTTGVERVKDVVRDLKLVAKDENVPIIGLSQMKREAFLEALQRGYYDITGFAESSEIEKSADLGAWFLVTPDMKRVNEMAWGIVKARHGPTTDEVRTLVTNYASCLIQGLDKTPTSGGFVDDLVS